MENELKKVKDTRSRQLDENDELRRIKAENTVLHRKLQGKCFISLKITECLLRLENTQSSTFKRTQAQKLDTFRQKSLDTTYGGDRL